MDVDTNIKEYFQVIQGQKQLLQRAKQWQGQCPRHQKPREQTYIQFMMALMATTGKVQHERHMVHSSFIPPAYPPCTTPLAQLKPITIRELRLETHHRGKYLVLRAVTPPNRMTGILVVAEDSHEDVVLLQMYHQEEEDVRQATDIVNVGTILLIKEPYFKFMSSGDYGLRVDHLSDVIRVNTNDPVIPPEWYPRITEAAESAELSKSKGDSAMGVGKYWKAIEEYIIPYDIQRENVNIR
jgi:hypothetical protein